MSRFVFIRHGEATHNVAQTQVGDSAYMDPAYEDAPLTENGKTQCRAAGVFLGALYPFSTACYTSPLTRCIQTAKEIRANAPFVAFHTSDALIECQGGGHICNRRKTKQEIERIFPGLETSGVGPTVPSETQVRETFEEVKARVVPYLKSILATYSSGDYLIVTHHDVLYSLLGTSVPNAGYVELSRAQLEALIN